MVDQYLRTNSGTCFQCRFPFAEAHRALQHQSLGFAHWPDHRFHRVPAQLLQSHDSLVAVNDHIPVRLAFGRHHYDGRLLAHFRQRRQQSPLSRWMTNSEMLPSPIELVKL